MQVIGREARAILNVGQAKGMTFWEPNINIFRDPRWSRGQETPGEDPFMTGRYAMLYVRGLQWDSFEGGQTPQHLQASACCRHFTAYNLDRWNGVTRYRFNALVSLIKYLGASTISSSFWFSWLFDKFIYYFICFPNLLA